MMAALLATHAMIDHWDWVLMVGDEALSGI
jgi:hypothetical protein